MHLHPLFTFSPYLPLPKTFWYFVILTWGIMNHSVCSSVCLRRFVFWPGTFFCFIIVLAYLAYGCIKIKHCVLYIHDRDTTMIFDLNKVKFIGFFTSLCVQPITSLSYDIGISYLATGFITMSQCVIFRIPICC